MAAEHPVDRSSPSRFSSPLSPLPELPGDLPMSPSPPPRSLPLRGTSVPSTTPAADDSTPASVPAPSDSVVPNEDMPEAESSTSALRKVTSIPPPLPAKRPRQTTAKGKYKLESDDPLESLSEGDDIEDSGKKGGKRGKKAKGKDGKPVRGEST